MAVQTIPALIALLFKFALLAYAVRSPRQNGTTRLFLALLGLLAIHNLIEFFGLNYFATQGLDQTMERYGYAYFALVICYTALTLHLSLRLSIDHWDRVKFVVPLLYLPVPILEFLLLGTDSVVAGFQLFQNYTILRVAGPLYFLFEAYALLYVLAALAYLIYGARRSRPSVINRTRNRLWLLGLLPFVLLHAYLIIANHFGLAKISSTVSVPIALTFFLIVTTYATHEYRLFDIEFFIPWSKVRKRKTAFYQRIRATIAEIAEMRSVKEVLQFLADIFHCQVALIGGLRPLVALAKGQEPHVSTQLLLSKFPREALANVDHIVIANEIADSRPELYALMKQHMVGAIVPFNSHSAASAHWMLLGDRFSDHVYTPLDFRFVEALFDRIAEHFVDNLALLRSQLSDAQEEVQDFKRRLAIAWDDLTIQRKKIALFEKENRVLREEKAQLLRRNLKVVEDELPEQITSGEKTIDRYMVEHEAKLVDAALRQSHGNKAKAARLLGIWPNKIDYLIERHNLDPKRYY